MLALLGYQFVSDFDIPGNWSFTKDIRQFEGRFFRMVVKLDYQGEPQTFDFVVGCQVKSILYQDGSRSRDVGFIPAVYGRRMKDNKAVVIRPPDVCNGETTTGGEVPAAFMPLIVVYDNADALDMGLAYLSDDAYDSPESDLKFHSAEILASSRAEFDADGKSGVPNLITREKFWSAQPDGVALAEGLRAIRPQYSKTCTFAQRYRLPDIVRERAREFWPATRPVYWFPASYDEEQAILKGLFSTNNESNREYWVQPEAGGERHMISSFRFSALDYGMARRNVEDWIHPTPFGRRTESKPIVAYYPVTSSISQRNWPTDPTQWDQFVADLKDPTARIIGTAGGRNRGFGACWSLRYDHLNKHTMKSLAQVLGHTTVDGSRVYSRTGERVTGVGGPDFIFEKDEYVFLIKTLDFGVMGGDVR